MKMVLRITVIGILVCMSINRAAAHIVQPSALCDPSARVY